MLNNIRYVKVYSIKEKLDPDFNPEELKPKDFIKDLDESEWFLVVKNDTKKKVLYISDSAGSLYEREYGHWLDRADDTNDLRKGDKKDIDRYKLWDQFSKALKKYKFQQPRPTLSAKSSFKRSDAEIVVNYLNKIVKPKCKRYEVAGSYRRNKPVIGDIEVLVVGITTGKILNILNKSKYLKVVKELWRGPLKMAVVVTFGSIKNLQLEFYVTESKYWAAALLTRTGNSTFNIYMRTRAKKRGMLLNEYGLYKDGKRITGLLTEEAIMRKLGMKYLEPEKRSL